MPGCISKLAAAVGAAALGGAAAESAAFVSLPALRASATGAAGAEAGAQRSTQAQGSLGLAGGATVLASLGAAAALAGAGRRQQKAPRADAKVVRNFIENPEDWEMVVGRGSESQGPKVLQGTGGPFPEDCWDPAGLTKNKTDEELLYYRAAEIKHGRTAMLACLGWFHVAAGWHPIGDAAARTYVSNDPLINAQQLSIGGWCQILFTLMCFEWMFTYVTKPPAAKPWDLLGWSSVIGDEEYPPWKRQALWELNNGRLAMVGIIGLIAQDAYTGEYFKEIGYICALKNFVPDGGSVCPIGQDRWSLDGVIASIPYDFPPLYPMS